MQDFIYMCGLCGIDDYLKGVKYGSSPKWMDVNERTAWLIGWNYAREMSKF